MTADDLQLELEMANGCLIMIYEKLVQINGEEAMSRTPPMFYPEAIHNINAKRLRAEATNTPLLAVAHAAQVLVDEVDRQLNLPLNERTDAEGALTRAWRRAGAPLRTALQAVPGA